VVVRELLNDEQHVLGLAERLLQDGLVKRTALAPCR
jgi:hypothetical protein